MRRQVCVCTDNLNVWSRWPSTRVKKNCVATFCESLNCHSVNIRMYCQSNHMKQVAQNAREKKLRLHLRQSLNCRSVYVWIVNMNIWSRWPRTRVERICVVTEYLNCCSVSMRMYCESKHIKQVAQNARQKNCVPTLLQSLNCQSISIRMDCQSEHMKKVAQNAHQKNVRRHLSWISKLPIRANTYVLSI